MFDQSSWDEGNYTLARLQGVSWLGGEFFCLFVFALAKGANDCTLVRNLGVGLS